MCAALVLLIAPLAITPAASAQSALDSIKANAYSTGQGAGLATTEKATDIRLTIAKIVKNVMGIIGILMVCLMLYAGFLYMTAGGNEEQVGKAKKFIVNAAIGLAITMSAYGIAQFTVQAITSTTERNPWEGVGGNISPI